MGRGLKIKEKETKERTVKFRCFRYLSPAEREKGEKD